MNDCATDQPQRILIACIGNIFQGDDAFGVEVARRFEGRTLPPGVRAVDFGIRGIDLTYALLDGCDAAILVDAVPRGGPPGTLYVIEPTLDPADAGEAAPTALAVEAHDLNPATVLRLVRSMGGQVRRVLIVGCEPGGADPDDMAPELSPPVRAAVEQAVPLIESLVEKIRREEPSAAPKP